MRRGFLMSLTVVAVIVLAGSASAEVDPTADGILRAMGDYLAAIEEFSFEAEVAYDVFSNAGQEIQFGGSVAVTVQRPAGLAVTYDGDERRHRVVQDGSSLTMYDAATNLYAVADVPAEIGAAADQVFGEYGVSVPIADLTYPNPYDVLIENVESGMVVGRHAVDGVPCFHLAFQQEALDWQIWVEDGPQPLPRRLVITYKNEPGAPNWSARITDWDVVTAVSEHYFTFHPPIGASQVEFMAAPEAFPEKEVEP